MDRIKRKTLIESNNIIDSDPSKFAIDYKKKSAEDTVQIAFDSSIDILNDCFLNKFTSINAENYIYLSKFIKKEMNLDSVLVDFEIEEGKTVDYSNIKYLYNERSKRLKTIIDNSRNDNVETSKLIYKLKNKKDNKIHFFIERENNIAKLLLVDLYHLAIPSPHGKERNWKQMMNKKYKKYSEKCQNSHICLSEIFK